MRTNTTSDAPNAVTWGAFPHSEILQPTIVESISFLAWKDEAFEIGRNWARLYAPDSESRKLLDGIFDTYFLVNVVHNDFKNGLAIFEPFLGTEIDSLAAASGKARAPQVSDKNVPEVAY